MIEPKSDASVFLMVTNGFAEKQGIKLEIAPFKSDQIGLRALIAGEVDSYEGALTGTVVATSKGVDVKLLGAKPTRAWCMRIPTGSLKPS